MSRPTDAARLADLSPDAIAREVDWRVESYLTRLAFKLALGFELRVKRLEGGQSDLAATAHALTTYAQRGLPCWDWETHGEAADACHDLVSHVYARPADEGQGGDVGPLGEVVADLDLTDPVALVLVAAWARVTLSRGEGLTARQLAALAGVSVSTIDKLRSGG